MGRRSMLEMETLLARHLTSALDSLDAAGCRALEILLQQTDNDLLDWIAGVAPIPPEVDAGLIQRLRGGR